MGKISARSFAVTAVVYYFGNAYILGSNSHVGRDDWLCMLIACIFAVPPVLLIAYLAETHPGQDLFTIFKQALGNTICRVLALIYGVYAVFLLSMSLSCFSRYVCTCVLLQTPKSVMALMLAVCAYLFAAKEPSGIGRCASFLFPAVFLAVLLAFITSVPSAHFKHIFPIGRGDIWRGVYRSMAFPFVEPVLLFSLIPSVEDGTKKRHWLIPFLFSFAFLILNCMRNTMVLGDGLAGILSFPTTHADSVVGYESLEQRLEVLTTMVPAACGLVEAVLATIFASRAFDAFSGAAPNKISILGVLAAGFVICMLAYGTETALEYRSNIWPLVSLPLQFLVPALCLLVENTRRTKKAKIFLQSLKKTMK